MNGRSHEPATYLFFCTAAVARTLSTAMVCLVSIHPQRLRRIPSPTIQLIPFRRWAHRAFMIIATRSDVLVYSTPPLQEEIEITGPVKLILFAASSAPDTDFTARLIDVAPNGYAANLCEGIIRGRYRDSARRGTLMEPGRPYKFTIDLVATSNLFQRGHRIRLEVSSSNFPRFDRNLNAGGPVADASEPRTARQTVFHDRELPSHLLLPLIGEAR
jgi:putative CocE/NonD family hydrolase